MKEMIKKSWTWKFSKVLFYFHFILEWARRGQRSSNSFPFSFLNLIESKALENTPSNLQNSKRQLSFMVLLFYCFPLLNWFWTILCIYHHCYSIYFTSKTAAKTFVFEYILRTKISFHQDWKLSIYQQKHTQKYIHSYPYQSHKSINYFPYPINPKES